MDGKGGKRSLLKQFIHPYYLRTRRRILRLSHQTLRELLSAAEDFLHDLAGKEMKKKKNTEKLCVSVPTYRVEIAKRQEIQGKWKAEVSGAAAASPTTHMHMARGERNTDSNPRRGLQANLQHKNQTAAAQISYKNGEKDTKQGASPRSKDYVFFFYVWQAASNLAWNGNHNQKIELNFRNCNVSLNLRQ